MTTLTTRTTVNANQICYHISRHSAMSEEIAYLLYDLGISRYMDYICNSLSSTHQAAPTIDEVYTNITAGFIGTSINDPIALKLKELTTEVVNTLVQNIPSEFLHNPYRIVRLNFDPNAGIAMFVATMHQ